MFESAYVDIEYKAQNNLTGQSNITVITEITADDLQFGESEVKNFTIEVKGVNGYSINITKDNIQVLNNGTALNIEVNNSVITIKDGLKTGKYNLTIKYLGDTTFIQSVKNISLSVYGINATTSTNINSTLKGNITISVIAGDELLNITPSDLNITASYKDGNNTVNITVTVVKIENGTLYFTLGDGNFTTATLTIKYNNTEANVTLNRIYNVNIIPVTVSADYQDGNFTFKLIDVDTNEVLSNKTVSVTMTKDGTSIYFITINSGGGYNLGTTTTITSDENGIATLNNENFYPGLMISSKIFAPVGTYSITLTGSGAVKGSNTTNITINKIDVNIVLEKYEEYYGSEKKVKIIVTNAKTGKTVSGVYILLNITGATLSNPNQITDENGTIQLGVTGLYPNTFKMTFNANDTNLNNASSSGSFIIKKIPVVINGKDVTIYYNSGSTYTIKVTKDGKL